LSGNCVVNIPFSNLFSKVELQEHRGISTERVVVFYKYPRQQGVQR